MTILKKLFVHITVQWMASVLKDLNLSFVLVLLVTLPLSLVGQAVKTFLLVNEVPFVQALFTSELRQACTQKSVWWCQWCLHGLGVLPLICLPDSHQAKEASPSLVIVQSFSCVWLFVTQWTAAHQASLSFTVSQSLLKLIPTELVMPSNHFILCRSLLLLPQSFLASGSLPMSRLFASGGRSTGTLASASVLPMKIQDWFPWGLTGLIFLQSKGVSRVFSSTTVWKHQFFGAQSSLQFNSHIHTWLLEKPKVKKLWFNRPLSAKWWLRCGGKLRELSSRGGTGFHVESSRGEWCLEEGLQRCPQPSYIPMQGRLEDTGRPVQQGRVGKNVLFTLHSNVVQTCLLVVTGLVHLVESAEKSRHMLLIHLTALSLIPHCLWDLFHPHLTDPQSLLVLPRTHTEYLQFMLIAA